MKKQLALNLFLASILGFFTNLTWADSNLAKCPSNEVNPQILATQAPGSSACSLSPGSKNNPSFVSIPINGNYSLKAADNILEITRHQKVIYRVYCISADNSPATWVIKQQTGHCTTPAA